MFWRQKHVNTDTESAQDFSALWNSTTESFSSPPTALDLLTMHSYPGSTFNCTIATSVIVNARGCGRLSSTSFITTAWTRSQGSCTCELAYQRRTTSRASRLEPSSGTAERSEMVRKAPDRTFLCFLQGAARGERRVNPFETAFQTAVALAEHEGKRDKEGTILVTDRHLKSVLALSKDFKNYLTELHQGHDEAERARRRQERLDSFGNES